jgi:hypothetical protein
VVLYITGLGLKTLDAVEADPTATISPTLDAFHEVFGPSEIEE